MGSISAIEFVIFFFFVALMPPITKFICGKILNEILVIDLQLTLLVIIIIIIFTEI